MKKCFSVMIEYDCVPSHTDLDERFIVLAKKFKGRSPGSGFDLVNGIRDIDFDFKKRDDAHNFYCRAKKVRRKDIKITVNRVVEVSE